MEGRILHLRQKRGGARACFAFTVTDRAKDDPANRRIRVLVEHAQRGAPTADFNIVAVRYDEKQSRRPAGRKLWRKGQHLAAGEEWSRPFHTCHAARPSACMDSSNCLSLNVSMLAQKPL